MVSKGLKYSEIEKVVLVEKEIANVKQADISRDLIGAIAPDSKFKVFFAV